MPYIRRYRKRKKVYQAAGGRNSRLQRAYKKHPITGYNRGRSASYQGKPRYLKRYDIGYRMWAADVRRGGKPAHWSAGGRSRSIKAPSWLSSKRSKFSSSLNTSKSKTGYSLSSGSAFSKYSHPGKRFTSSSGSRVAGKWRGSRSSSTSYKSIPPNPPKPRVSYVRSRRAGYKLTPARIPWPGQGQYGARGKQMGGVWTTRTFNKFITPQTWRRTTFGRNRYLNS